MNTWTATVSNGEFTIGKFIYYVSLDTEIIEAIRQVHRTAQRWKRQCCGKKTGKRMCEAYGCASLDELLAPLNAINAKLPRKPKSTTSRRGRRRKQ